MLLQLHLHSQLNTWLQWIGQMQLQGETTITLISGFGAAYIGDFTVYAILFHSKLWADAECMAAMQYTLLHIKLREICSHRPPVVFHFCYRGVLVANCDVKHWKSRCVLGIYNDNVLYYRISSNSYTEHNNGICWIMWKARDFDSSSNGIFGMLYITCGNCVYWWPL